MSRTVQYKQHTENYKIIPHTIYISCDYVYKIRKYLEVFIQREDVARDIF